MSEKQQWQEFFYTSSDGLRLAGRKYGWHNNGATPVVCLAGLTRNSADFHELAVHLSSREKSPRKVLCLDYRGRGLSAYDKNWQNYNPLVEAGDTIDGILAAGLHEVAIVGTSRGGLITMALSAMRPGMLKSVVFNDIGPEVNGTGLIRIKNYIENAKPPRNWNEAAEAIKAIAAAHFPKWDEKEFLRQAHLIFKEEDGKIVRRYDEAIAKTLSSINLNEPLPTFWPQFEGLKKLPLLLIRGDNSDLLSPETVDQMHETHPSMQTIIAEDQGHAPDLGLPELARGIGKFLSEND